jgi:hypothetical protein
MLDLPQMKMADKEAEVGDEDIIPMDETDKVLEKLLRIICAFEVPQWESYDDVKGVLFAADKYDMPGPISIIRSAITAPSFLKDPLQLYALATRFSWVDEAKLASRLSLSLYIYDPEHEPTLHLLSPEALLQLLRLHQRRKVEFDALLRNDQFFQAGNAYPGRNCTSCGKAANNYPWRDLRTAILSEFERRPSGEKVLGADMVDWPETKSCWDAACSCGTPLYNKRGTTTNIKVALDMLPSTI